MKLPDWFTKDNTFFLPDFDRCLSKWGKGSLTSYWVFDAWPWAPKEYVEKRTVQAAYYRALELEYPTGEEHEKNMWQWRKEAMELFQRYISKDDVEEITAFAAKNIQLREWFSELAQKAHELWIPFIVYTAWVKDIVDAVLKYNNIPYSASHWNTLRFWNDWMISWIKNNPPISSATKDWENMPQKIKELVFQRSHVIPLGDSIPDKDMWPKDFTSFSIWFLLQEHKKNEQKFGEAFDYLVESDTSDNWVLKKVIEQLKNW